MKRRQNSKNKKRPKWFHRENEGLRWLQASKKINTEIKVDYTEAVPVPLRRKGKNNKGEALS